MVSKPNGGAPPDGRWFESKMEELMEDGLSKMEELMEDGLTKMEELLEDGLTNQWRSSSIFVKPSSIS